MKFINLHTHNYSNQENSLEIVNQYPQDFNDLIPNYSIGIHPWKIEKNRIEADLQIVNQHLSDYGCLAIGECGLDKRIETSFDLQIEVFEKQVALAIKHQKPIILHCVGAFQEIIEIKKRLKIDVPIIVHGFSKNYQIVKQLLDNGFYLSFGKYLILNPELENVFKNIQNDKFFLETDSSNYTIEEVYNVASKCKNITVEELKVIVQSNFQTVFK
jgi:TatD DNase family protein